MTRRTSCKLHEGLELKISSGVYQNQFLSLGRGRSPVIPLHPLAIWRRQGYADRLAPRICIIFWDFRHKAVRIARKSVYHIFAGPPGRADRLPEPQIPYELADGGAHWLAVPWRRQISAKSSITRPLGCLVVPSVARILINGYISKIRVTPKATLSSNGRSPIRFGKNRLKTGGSPKKPRKSVDDSTITSDRGNDRLRSHPDKYCTWGEKDTRY